ncbi:MAG: hypothetical protein GVY16_09705 [Planctomycetes bacterium]|nr:VTT domain-containing protein [Phycisphaerae bacterium]NBB95996.1 hypothetical protein [Planctomycetota bacterium]
MSNPDPLPSVPGDNVCVVRWFTVFSALWLAALGILVALLSRTDIGWSGSWGTFLESLDSTPAAIKLLVFGLYISLCCTFLPLPTGPMVALVSLQQSAVGDSIASTTLLVATVGALASTLANLNDYHAFTLLLRNHKVAKVRDTTFYDKAATWFHKSPFVILIVFNIIPIPVDVIRMLATTARYPRWPFAAANFIGRIIRYGVIAAVTYALGETYGWLSVVVLLGVAVALGIYRVLPGLTRTPSRGKPDNERETST